MNKPQTDLCPDLADSDLPSATDLVRVAKLRRALEEEAQRISRIQGLIDDAIGDTSSFIRKRQTKQEADQRELFALRTLFSCMSDPRFDPRDL